mmetsp:Transcript_11364/g.25305  ORF Transcript_11364/g.25305 Transcript_11364/m.25305 type:complete len:532 (-) Transcript_11364:63-1658(-)
MSEKWDLTSRVSPYLDRHMMFPLLEFLDGLIGSNDIGYPSDEIQAARLALLRPTKMKDYAMDILNASSGIDNKDQLLKELDEEKKTVLEQLETLKEGCKSLQELCDKEDQLTKIKAAGQWNVAGLEKNHNITKEMVDTYRQLARFKYDCGDYNSSRDMLAHYIALFASPPPTSDTNANNNEEDDFLQESTANNSSSSKDATGNASMYYLKSVDQDMLQVLWGKLASDIMAEDWTAASKAVEAVRTAIESMVSNNNNSSSTASSMSHIQALQQRTWLLHWSLFVYWQINRGLEHLLELFHTDRYKQAITTHAPHLLRYLTAAVLLCKRRKKNDKDKNSRNNKDDSPMLEARRMLRHLVYVMQDCEYTDPIVDFVHSLLVKFDFEMAQTKLAECQDVLKTDFFLCKSQDVFMEEARVFLFENYCRIHHKIDLKALDFKFLAMDPAEAERWMVDLIRQSDVLQQQSSGGSAAAKVQQDDCVIMELEPQSIYEQVMDRTRDLNVRSATLSQSLQNRLVEAKKEKAKRERAAREEE